MNLPIDGFTQFDFTDAGIEHTVYRKGSGPGVLVMHELPGLTPRKVGLTSVSRNDSCVVPGSLVSCHYDIYKKILRLRLSSLQSIKRLIPLAASGIILINSGCTGPIQDNVGPHFRAFWIASRSKLPTPYADYPNTQEGRNEFIDDFVSIKNVQFHNYVSAIRRGTSYGQLGADSSRLVLDGVAATTGGVAVKAALAAASAGITGFSSSFQKDVLFDQALPTFIEKMEELRANKLADITNKKKLLIGEYTLSEAYNDVEDYGSDGSFDAALRDINAKTGQAASTAKTALAVAKGDTVTAAASSSGGAVQPVPLPPPPQNTRHGVVVTDAVQASRVAAIKTIRDLNLDATTAQPFLDGIRQAQDIPTINNIIVQATTAKSSRK